MEVTMKPIDDALPERSKDWSSKESIEFYPLMMRAIDSWEGIENIDSYPALEGAETGLSSTEAEVTCTDWTDFCPKESVAWITSPSKVLAYSKLTVTSLFSGWYSYERLGTTMCSDVRFNVRYFDHSKRLNEGWRGETENENKALFYPSTRLA